jgi:hypothetical protein
MNNGMIFSWLYYDCTEFDVDRPKASVIKWITRGIISEVGYCAFVHLSHRIQNFISLRIVLWYTRRQVRLWPYVDCYGSVSFNVGIAPQPLMEVTHNKFYKLKLKPTWCTLTIKNFNSRLINLTCFGQVPVHLQGYTTLNCVVHMLNTHKIWAYKVSSYIKIFTSLISYVCLTYGLRNWL